MRAIQYTRYGGPEALHLAEVPGPNLAPDGVLVRVRATSVTTADWRLRAAAFPGILWLPGRLMFGLLRPRKRIWGGEFAGEVAEVGAEVTAFKPGDRVFGFAGTGAYADYLAITEAGAIAALPEGLGFDEAAALPFGAVCALVFLRDIVRLRPGQRLLVTGASGGVGTYAVQIGRHLGARVTGSASAANLDLVRELGAEAAIDYQTGQLEAEVPADARYDAIFDTVGALSFRQARRLLAPDGVFVPLNFGLREMLQALVTPLFGRQRLRIHVSDDSKANLLAVKSLVETGALRPVIDRRYTFGQIREAHAYVEARHRRGSVILTPA